MLTEALSALALAAALPLLVHPSYTRLERAIGARADASHHALGFASRRWQAEFLCQLLLCLLLAGELAAGALRALREGPTTAALGPLGAAALGLGVMLYSCVASLVFTDYADAKADVPRHASVETRRPRYVWYHARTRARLAPMRAWFVLLAGWSAWRTARTLGAAGCSAAALASSFARVIAWAPPGGEGAVVAQWALLRATQCLAPAEQPPLAGAGALLLAALEEGGEQGAAPPLHLLPALALAAHAARLLGLLLQHGLPLLLGALALHCLLCMSAAEFRGDVAPGSPQQDWLWPPGQVGVAAWQAAPPRMSDSPLASAAAVAAVEAAAAAAAPSAASTLALATAACAAAADERGAFMEAPPAEAPPPPPPTTTPRARRSSSIARQAPAPPPPPRVEPSGLQSPPPSAPLAPSARRRRPLLAALTTLPDAAPPPPPPDAPPLGASKAHPGSSSSGGGGGALLSPPALSHRGRSVAASAGGPQYAFPDSALLMAAAASPPRGLGLGGGRSGSGGGLLERLRPQPASAASAARLPGCRLRIAILTVGTRGDVQPYITLGCALRDAGHAVVISSTDDFEEAVVAAGLEFGRTGAPRMTQPDSWVSGSTRTVADMILSSARAFVGAYLTVSDGFAAACAGADVILGTSMTITFALNVAESMGHAVPVWCAKLAPDLPTPAYSPPGTLPSACGALNLARCYSYWVQVALAVNRAGITAEENAFRARLGLSPLAPSVRLEEMGHTPSLLGWSSHLFPPPTDYPPWATPCGFWLSGEEAPMERLMAPPDVHPRLAAFVAQTAFLVIPSPANGLAEPALDSRPLAVVTFGSMMLAGDGLLGDIIRTLREQDEYTVLVLTGWKGLPPGCGPAAAAAAPPAGASGDAAAAPHPLASFVADPRVLFWPEAPHAWLFDKARLVVHHGGAGTTGRALASGVAQLIIPVLRWSDQVQWGALVQGRGVGVVLSMPSPTASDLRAALGVLERGDRVAAPHTGSLIGDAANRLGAVVRAQPSCATALAALESCLCNRVLPPALADAVHPAALDAAAARSPRVLAALTAAQRMCVRSCVPCSRVRARLELASGSGAAGGR